MPMLMTMLMLMWCQCQCKCKILGAGCDLPCPVGHLSCPCHCPLFKQVGVRSQIMLIMMIMLMIMMTMMILTRVVECWCSGEKGTSSWTLSTLPNAISPSLLTRWYIIISVASGVMYTLPNPNATNPSLLTRSVSLVISGGGGHPPQRRPNKVTFNDNSPVSVVGSTLVRFPDPLGIHVSRGTRLGPP